MAKKEEQRYDPNKPDFPSLAYTAAKPAMDLCRDVFEGTLTIRAKAKAHLPQFPLESNVDYAARVSTAVLHNAFKRTTKGLAGMVFRQDPVPSDDVPDGIEEHLKNIDLAGRDLTSFARDGFEDKTQVGHGVIFVDWHDPDDARTRLEEKSMGARPFWVWIAKDQIIRWRTESRDGRTVLTSFAYVAEDTVPEGEFGEKAVLRVRQYDLRETGGGARVQYRSWVRDKDTKGEWDPEDGHDEDILLGDNMDRIPVSVDYADRTGFLTSDPPLLDLALENIRHAQIQSDRDDGLHTTMRAVFTVIGVDPADMGEVVTDQGLALPEVGQSAQYTEAEGNGLEEAREELGDTRQRMAVLGLSMLMSETRSAETAESKRIDKAESDSRLASMARASQTAINGALELHAQWVGEDEGGTVTINTDFLSEPMSPRMVDVLARMVGSRNLSQETLWELLVRGEILPDTFDAEDERARIESEPGDTLGVLRDIRAAAAGSQNGDTGDGEEG